MKCLLTNKKRFIIICQIISIEQVLSVVICHVYLLLLLLQFDLLLPTLLLLKQVDCSFIGSFNTIKNIVNFLEHKFVSLIAVFCNNKT